MTGTYGTDGKPTGPPLAISDDFEVSTLKDEFQLITFFFTREQQYEMQAGTKYCIVFENPASGIISRNVRPEVECGGGHDGNIVWFRYGAWVYIATASDILFYVYGK